MKNIFRTTGIVFLLLMLVACGQTGPLGRAFHTEETANWSKDIHIVQRGDTLYSISWQYGKDVRILAEWNDLKPPYIIFPQQKIRLTRPSSAKEIKVSINKNLPSKTVKQHSRPRTVKNETRISKNSIRSKRVRWQWPTNGNVINKFSASDPGRRGIDIAGQAGQPVYAAADGQIVYSGGGLRGYGELIIIQHNDTFFSAYAHNQRLLKKEGKKVKKGERIADMGRSGSDRVKLHFEIRRNGVPVNPYYYLPKR